VQRGARGGPGVRGPSPAISPRRRPFRRRLSYQSHDPIPIHKILRSTLLAAALLVVGVPAVHAQADSTLAVSQAGINLLRLNTDASFVVRGTQDAGSLPATGAGVRMMWFPARYAFRAASADRAFARTERQRARIAELEAQVRSLEERLARMEALLAGPE
jgi:hypothetical protein